MIVVGVAGHRVLADIERVRSGVDSAIRRVQARYPGDEIRVMSALAEGADRLITESILAQTDSRLTAVLPLPPADYMKDFASAESRNEFERLIERADELIVMDPAPTRDKAYEAAAGYVLDNSDLLIAIWDGNEAQGRGGTGQTVARARHLGLPIAVVHAGNRKPGSMVATTLGERQGGVLFENL